MEQKKELCSQRLYHFSVLMSVYDKENPVFLDKALGSVLISQTLTPTELILVKDGPLSAQLDQVIEKYLEIAPCEIKVVALERNQGLGIALNYGLAHCSYELVARMDSDDISVPQRFELQIPYMTQHPEYAVVGGYVGEFYDIPEEIQSIRQVPQENLDILRTMKRRNPMNHNTVVMRKSLVEQVGGYQYMPYTEDYYLWMRIAANRFALHNLGEILVWMRTGEGMFQRRSNQQQIASWKEMQRFMLKNGLIDQLSAWENMALIRLFVYTPAWCKQFLYEHILRKCPAGKSSNQYIKHR